MSYRILIVDDNDNNRFTLSSLLETLRVEVVEAVDGSDALACLMKDRIDLIILDIQLPDFDGFEVAKLIKKRKSTKHIPIIFATAVFKSEEFIEKGYALGAVDYVMKPFNADMLQSKVSYYKSVEEERQSLINKLTEKNEELLQMIENLESAQHQLREVGFHDQLTGLKNRHYLMQYIRKVNISDYLPVSIIMADVNGLKLINDGFGHTEGDELIKAAAHSFTDNIDKEAIITRWGGDEFLILLPDTREGEVNRIAKDVQKSIEGKKIADKFPVSLAIGVSTSDNAEFSIEKLIKIAEDQMYINKMQNQDSYRSFIVESLKGALFEQDYETKEHTERISQIAMIFADHLQISHGDKNKLVLLGSLHDIGKIGISNRILNQPGKLSEIDWNIVKRHPEIGYRICNAVPELMAVADLILAHHERWDGQGYPRGLRGIEIPLLARLIAILDTFDVITHDRPYKEAKSVEWALEEIRRCAGTQFDPNLVSVFEHVMIEIMDEHKDIWQMVKAK